MTSAFDPCWAVTWVTGPDAGRTTWLGPGDHLVGRAPQAHVRCDDPELEPFHATLTLPRDAGWVVHQLSGRVPVECSTDGVRLGASVLRITPAEPLSGATHRESCRPESRDGADTQSRTIVRPPRVVPRHDPVGLARHPAHGASGGPGLDTGTSAFTGLVGAAVAAVVGLVIAVVVGQSMFAVFALSGLLVAAVTVGIQWRAERRRRRAATTALADAVARWHDERELQRADWVAHHLARTGTLPAALASLALDPPAVWARRVHHGDATVVSLGIGTVPWVPVTEHGAGRSDAARRSLPSLLESGGEAVAGLPVAVDLAPGAVVVLRGPHAAGLARSLVVQLASQCGPADWHLHVDIADTADAAHERLGEWAWAAMLAHARSGPAADCGPTGSGPGTGSGTGSIPAHRVVVTDRLDDLASVDGPLRRALAGPQPPAVIVVAGTSNVLPAVCTAVVDTTLDGRARARLDLAADADPIELRVCALSRRGAADAAAALAGWLDPEDPSGRTVGDPGLPVQVPLTELLAAHLGIGIHPLPAASADPLPAALTDPRVSNAGPAAARSRHAGEVQAGEVQAGEVQAGEVQAGEVQAGEVQAGEVQAARMLAKELAEVWATGPTGVCTPIGRSASAAVEIDLGRDGPHGLVAGTTGAGKSDLLRSLVLGLAVSLPPDRLGFVLVDYKGGATFDACAALPHVLGVVTDLDGALAERVLRGLAAELTRRERLLRAAPGESLPRLVVVVDEYAALAAEQPAFLHALVDIAQRGRSLGIHLLLATQRPAGVVNDDVRANTQLRIALRVHDRSDAVDVVGDALPSMLPRDVPGRAVVRLGTDDLLTFQTAHADAATIAAVVDLVREAADVRGALSMARPWLDELPALLSAAEVAASGVGLVDLPDEQRRVPLRWSPSDGGLVVVGAPGSGVSSTLATLVDALAAGPEAVEVYVIDALGDRRWDDRAACAVVVGLHEDERLWRLLARLSGEHPVAPSSTAAAGTDVATNSTVGTGAAQSRAAVLVIDGVGALRRHLDRPARLADLDRLDRIASGTGLEMDARQSEARQSESGQSARVSVVLGGQSAAEFPPLWTARCAARWVLHLHDPYDAAMMGVSAAAMTATAGVPGRLMVAGQGRTPAVAQVVMPDGLRTAASWSLAAARAAPRLDVLAHRIDPAHLADLARSAARSLDATHTLHPSTDDVESWRAVLGVDALHLGPAELDVPSGEHLLVVGSARSGRSTALAALVAAARAGGMGVTVVAGRSAAGAGPVTGAVDLQSHPHLLAVDDADLLDELPSWLGLDPDRPVFPSRLTVVAVVDVDGLRQAGTRGSVRPDGVRGPHWTSLLRRSRRGIVLTLADELAGDVLGVVLPRRLPIAPRPGLAHLVQPGLVRLVQLVDAPDSPTGRPDGRRVDGR